jgi:alpha-N-acetylglucosamine transferase
MVSYRTAKGYHGKFGRAKDSSGVFQARSYLAYQVRSTSVLYTPFLFSSHASSSFCSLSSPLFSDLFLLFLLSLPFLFLHLLS